MKVAGVVRRIDELGRIVIPKEIRKTLRIKNGENLEIFISNENIILKKYSELGNLSELSDSIVESLNSYLKANVLITDTNRFISINGPLKKKYLNLEISEELFKIINNRKPITINNKSIYLTKDNKEEKNTLINPIISNGDVIGSIIIISDKEIAQSDMKIAEILSNVLAKHIES